MANANYISRRRLLRMSGGALLAAGLWPGAMAAEDADASDFEFIAVNDLHLMNDKCVPFFQRMVQKMKEASPKSKLLLVCGDLVEDGKAEQFAPIGDVLKTVGMTTKVVVGNHDWLANGDRKAFEQAWPDSLNYTFEHGGWQIVCLDSSDGQKSSVEVQKPTFQWLDENMPRLDKKRPMILMTHFPMGILVPMRPKNADDLLDRFKGHNLRAVFNGHYHGFTERSRGNYVLTTDKCCSFRRPNHDKTPEKGFFACRAKDRKVERTFVEVKVSA